MRTKNDRTTSRVAQAAIICVPAALAFLLVSAALTFVGAHRTAGVFVAACIFLFVGAFVLGLVSLVVVVIRRKDLKGWPWAFLAILLSAPVIYVLGGVWCGVRAREKRKREWSGLYNLEVLGKELSTYAKNHNGCLPGADQWCDSLMEHTTKLTKENFRHPQPKIFGVIFNFTGDCQFAFNKNLGGMRLADIPGDVVLLFEADGGWNLTGTEELLKTRYSDGGYVTILFADGSMGDFWFDQNAVRKFDSSGQRMYYERPRWKP